MISQYCTECLKFTNQHCKGKEGGEKVVEFFGAKSIVNPSFLKFCKGYEFDKKLLPRLAATVIGDGVNHIDSEFEPYNKGKAKSVKRKRVAAKHKRVEAAVNVAAAEEAEIGENLNSSDFDDLLI